MKIITEFLKKRMCSKMADKEKSLLPEPEPERSPGETKNVTDKWFLYIFGICLLIFLPLMIYTLHYSDINRLKGYDTCGNICGQENREKGPMEYSDCGRVDLFDKPYYSGSGQCDVIPSWLKRHEDQVRNVDQRLSYIGGKLILASLMPLSLSLVLAILFRYATSFTVIIILIISWSYLVGGVFISVIRLFYALYLLPAVLVALLFILTFIIICNWNRINLAIVMFKESSKAISNIKTSFFVPIIFLLLILAVVRVSTLTTIHMSTAGFLQPVHNWNLDYIPNGFMIAAIFLNVVLTLWVVQILLGVQNMFISGAVSTWYSSRVPVDINFYDVLKYRLGTVALGSLMINLMTIPRGIFMCASQISVLKGISDAILRHLNGIFHYYVVSAAQGKPFFKSGKTVTDLLNLKIADTVIHRHLGAFVMFLCHFLLLSVSLVVAVFGIFYRDSVYIDGSSDMLDCYYYCYFFVPGISLICSHTILGPIQTAFDTMFFCICEEIIDKGEARHSMTINDYLNLANSFFDRLAKGNTRPTTIASDVV